MTISPIPFLAGLALMVLAFSMYRRRWQPMRLVTIIDGDTFLAVDLKGTKRKLRLLDVDCPEMDQRNGPEAKQFVHNIGYKELALVSLRGRDKYRRHLAHVRINGTSLALRLVQEGLAYPLKNSWRFRLAATRARLQRKGVHNGFGQRKPWEASSRTMPLLRWLKRKRKI